MGPRSADRGIVIIIVPAVPRPWLQWGRDQLIAELCQTRTPTKPQAWLQWGRDQLIAELRSEMVMLPTVFMLQWGRDQLIAELDVPPQISAGASQLQWGRDQLIAELSRKVWVMMRDQQASMGPRSADRGIAALQIVQIMLHEGFNGAAIS